MAKVKQHVVRNESSPDGNAAPNRQNSIFAEIPVSTIQTRVIPNSFTRQLAFSEPPTYPNQSSFYSDYRSNILAKVATAVILAVTVLLLVVFAVKNRRIDALIQAQFDRIREQENRIAKTEKAATTSRPLLDAFLPHSEDHCVHANNT